MNLQATTPANAEPLPSGPIKFTYPSGSRPLAGYTIKRGIGRGGFGEVYYAVSDGGKEVALKLIRRNLEVELRGVIQCLNLKHSNLLALYDIKQDEQGDSWVIMEYVPGECLEDVVNRAPHGLPPDDALRWMRGILAGVAYLHDHGIVHRDLKPGNVFSDEGVVKIGDYGLSKFISCSRRSGQTESVGTVHYMAPEIANGRYGKEIDVYAIGVIFYELLTGRVPFEGESVGEVLMKHLTAEPDLSGVSEPYRTAIGRTLTKDPTQRIGSVQELAALLPGLGSDNLGPARTASASMPVTPLGPPPVPAEMVTSHARPALDPMEKAAYEADRVFDDDEPILRAIRTNYRELEKWWGNNGWPRGVKIALVVMGCLFLVKTADKWAPMAGALLAAYVVYRVVRWVFVAPKQRRVPPVSAAPVAAQAAARTSVEPVAAPVVGSAPAEPQWRTGKRLRRWRKAHLADTLPIKTPRERLTDLLGSMLLSAVVAGVISLLIFVVVRGREPDVNQYTWLALASVVGSWIVLVPSKLWEGKEGDAMLRRFTLMVGGLAVGGLAYLAKTGLLVDLPYEMKNDLPAFTDQQHMGEFYTAGHSQPSALAFLMYFAFLFLIVRWWRQADPLRSSRLSLWYTGVTAFCAALVSAFWPFPQPWGIMTAVTISICVQLASPWINYRDRTVRPDY